MTSIYNFEQYTPPRLTEKQLREELKRREIQKQAILLCVASFLMYLCIVLVSILICREHFMLAVFGILSVCISLMGNGIITVVFYYYRKRRILV